MISIEDAWAAFLKSPVIQGVVLAFVMAVLRVAYDSKETKWARMALEGAMAGGITLAGSALLSVFGLSEQTAIALGGCIGCLGVEKFRDLMGRWFEKKLGDTNDSTGA